MFGSKLIWTLVVGVAVGAAAFLGFSYEAAYSVTDVPRQLFHIKHGESTVNIAQRLENAGLIRSRWFFIYELWKENLRGKIIAGDYQLGGRSTVPDILSQLTSEGGAESLSVEVTFPEGWESRKMAERLNANALPGDAFLALVREPIPSWREKYAFLKDVPQGASLEGFLFPDTYSFFKKATAEDIVTKILNNFDAKLTVDRQADIERSGKSLFETVTLASIVENEVISTLDRRKVADIFWRRLAADHPLQSDATVKYVLGENKIQHSLEETRVASPYNTYVNKGLPPGPISNPGLDALDATIHPSVNPYFYFLSDPTTGETVFATTFEEHVANKTRHGL